MRKIEEIEQQIRGLSVPEFAELRDWMLEQDWKAWDAKIDRDVRSGKLENLVAEARADYAAGLARDL
jgi:outer membrane biogenesis lipoprotein LolB